MAITRYIICNSEPVAFLTYSHPISRTPLVSHYQRCSYFWNGIKKEMNMKNFIGMVVACVLMVGCGGSDVEAPSDCNEGCSLVAETCGGSTFVDTESGLIRKSEPVPGVCGGSCVQVEQGVELNHCPQPGYVFLCSNPQEAIQSTIKKCTPSPYQDTEGVSFWCCDSNQIQ